MKAIAVIGAGNIGSRHLQGLKRMEGQLDIYVFDPNQASIDAAKSKWEEVENVSFTGNIHFLQNMSTLPKNIDLAIIATSSLVRLAAIEQLLAISNVQYVVLEKFLFPSSKDYSYTADLFKSRGIKAYVNCARRLYPHYRQIAAELSQDGGPFGFTFEGSKFGLASNAIHSIDLFDFLLKGEPFELDVSGINRNLIHSKREGYYELSGRITALSRNGSLLNICCFESGSAKNLVTITSAGRRYLITERDGSYLMATAENNWQWEQHSFDVPLQSVLSHVFANDILTTGNCNLTPYEISAALHLQFLEAVHPIFEHLLDQQLDICPIT